jgi:hypothetical protein
MRKRPRGPPEAERSTNGVIVQAKRNLGFIFSLARMQMLMQTGGASLLRDAQS